MALGLFCLKRSGAVAARESHKLKAAGSNPASATNIVLPPASLSTRFGGFFWAMGHRLLGFKGRLYRLDYLPNKVDRMIKVDVVDQRLLTDREAEVLGMVCEGLPDKVIARRLAISVRTVHAHIDRIYAKLNVREAQLNARCAAIGQAVASGMVRLSVSVLCAVLMVQEATVDSAQVLRTASAKVRVRREC